MNSKDLLIRDEFRKQCLSRDGNKCVLCGETNNLVVHHIVERRLFDDGGFYLSNGATLCEEHHWKAEATIVGTQQLRDAVGITRIVLPEHLDSDETYTKWADVELENGMRNPGELFDDASVQKVIAPVIHLYTSKYKHPRTYHLTYSRQRTADDKTLKSEKQFEGKEVVVSIKFDGENTSLYRDSIHARSLDYGPHPSRSRIRALHAQLRWDIPDHMRVCGENLFGKHTIKYHNLPAFFMVHSIWDRGWSLSWDETKEWSALLGLLTVPELYRGIYDDKLVRSLYTSTYAGDPVEGFVVRLTSRFPMSKFRMSTGKYVHNPISAANHWYHTQFEENECKS